MKPWIVVPSLVSLKDEFNLIAPKRDKKSDGTIADQAHFDSGNSDHIPDEMSYKMRDKDSDSNNEVHGLDVDSDLNSDCVTMQKCVDIIVERHREGKDHRLQYVIWKRRIASRSWGWTWRDYTGPSPHTEHAHFSARYETENENNTAPWGLLAKLGVPTGKSSGSTVPVNEPVGVDMEDEEMAKLAQLTAREVWKFTMGTEATANRWKDKKERSAASFLMLGAIGGFDAAVAALDDMSDTDRAQIITGILNGLTPGIAKAIPDSVAKRVVDLLHDRLAG